MASLLLASPPATKRRGAFTITLVLPILASILPGKQLGATLSIPKHQAA